MSEQPTPETDIEHLQFAMGGFTLDFCRKLERERDEARGVASGLAKQAERICKERDEARNKMADALQEVDLRTLDYERMKQERDEAREKIERQAARIRELEGATNHAGGLNSPKYHGTDETDAMVEMWQITLIPSDFARRMEAERNEARRLAGERLAQLTAITSSEPSDYLGLVTACRVHKGHIAQLIKERDEARQWKKEMLLVESQWDEQAVGRLLGLQLGESIKANIEPKLRQLIRERDEAREALKKCREDSICYAEHMRKCGYSEAYKESNENADRATRILEGAK